MARWKLAILTAAALVPVIALDYHKGQWNPMTVGVVAFSVLMLTVPRDVTHRKWFAFMTGIIVFAVLPIAAVLTTRSVAVLLLPVAMAGLGISTMVRYRRQSQ